jgi:Restriction endonuclease BglII
MKIAYEYSHFGGSEIIKAHYPAIESEIYSSIAAVKSSRPRSSNDKMRSGEVFLSPVELHDQFNLQFKQYGYTEINDIYTITLPNSEKIIPGVHEQIDFHKDKVLIQVQFDQCASLFHDMAKFQYFYDENKASVGVEILPSHKLYKRISIEASCGEQLVYDIEQIRQRFPAVPVKVILIDED